MNKPETSSPPMVVGLDRKVSPLPCPFCGHQPKVTPSNPKLDGNAWGRVVCVNEECAAQPFVDDGEDCCDERGSDAYKQAAILRWNKRANYKIEQPPTKEQEQKR